jgi:muramoyltetrapeptide carboxypeptidase
MVMDTALRTLAMQADFSSVRGLVLGRFPSSAGVDREALRRIVQGIAPLGRLPVLANVDFGHTTPVMTIPIGGRCALVSTPRSQKITLLEH